MTTSDKAEARRTRQDARWARRELIDGRLVATHLRPDEHGGTGSYTWWGCRCDVCVKAKTERHNAWGRERTRLAAIGALTEPKAPRQSRSQLSCKPGSTAAVVLSAVIDAPDEVAPFMVIQSTGLSRNQVERALTTLLKLGLVSLRQSTLPPGTPGYPSGHVVRWYSATEAGIQAMTVET